MAGFEARQPAPAGITPVRRDYIRARDLKTPQKAAESTKLVISDWQTQRIKLALGQAFKQTSRVVIMRPRFMPRWLLVWLFNRVVIEYQDAQERVA